MNNVSTGEAVFAVSMMHIATFQPPMKGNSIDRHLIQTDAKSKHPRLCSSELNEGASRLCAPCDQEIPDRCTGVFQDVVLNVRDQI